MSRQPRAYRLDDPNVTAGAVQVTEEPFDAIGRLDGVERFLGHDDAGGGTRFTFLHSRNIRVIEAKGARLSGHASLSPIRNSSARSRRICGSFEVRPAASTESFGGRKRGNRSEPGGTAP